MATPCQLQSTTTTTMPCSRSTETPPCPSETSSTCSKQHILPKWLIPANQRGWRRLVQNFTPAWFSVTMGTGIVSIIFNTLSLTYPAHKKTLTALSLAFFALNTLLFTLILALSAARYTLYPATWPLMLHHPTQSLFLGTLPMGLATLLNMFVAHCIPTSGGGAALTFAWAIWWLDVALSVACCTIIPFLLTISAPRAHISVTAAWLLPIVAPIVAAASGGVIAAAQTPHDALVTIVSAYVLWGMAVPFALLVLGLYFARLVLHGQPGCEVVVSVFLPIGMMGQGGYGFLVLGEQAERVFGAVGTLGGEDAGLVLRVLGWGVAVLLWGFGLVWVFFAGAALSAAAVRNGGKIPFNMGWWGFTFPLGVFAVSTLAIGREADAGFFRVVGTVLAGVVVMLWVVVAAGTVRSLVRGGLVEAPCLREMERRAEEARRAVEEKGEV